MGFAVFIDNDIVILLWSKSLKIAFVGHIENNLYVVDFSGKTTTNAMCLFGKADVGWLLASPTSPCQHENFAKPSQGRPHTQTKRKCFFCQRSYLQGLCSRKMHDSPHSSKTIISSNGILELLHVDLFDPSSHASLCGQKYCLVIVDDYSKYTWVYFFEYKSETQQTIIDFAKEVEHQYG
jgi:hypothetical protein